MQINNPYRILGITLATAGAILVPVFYFIVNSPALTATGISAIILGFTCIAVANARPYLSPEAAQMLLKTGMENTAALLEELGLNNKAIYMPAGEAGKARALIPLASSSQLTAQNLELRTQYLGDRLIVRYGPGVEDMAIAVTTPGSVNLQMLENKPGPTAGEIESALNYLLTGVLDIARGVTVNIIDSRVEVKISDARMSYENVWYYRSLGSPIASIAAVVVSEALNKPVRIAKEAENKGKSVITLEIM
jgi:hypothetical protein